MSRLRAQVASLEGEREMRVKLEKLLEVQTVQVDLQKELRMKTESLLQVEQQTTSKLRQQLEEARTLPGNTGRQEPDLESRALLEGRFDKAQKRIASLERQLAEATAPETSDRVESKLRHQIEEQERLIESLQEQMSGRGHAGGTGQPVEGEVVRLQLLLQSRDRHLDELSQTLRKAQSESAESQAEVDVLRHQVRVLKKEVAERTDEMERQLRSERDLRAETFQLHAKLERSAEQHHDESRRCAGFAETAAYAEDRQRRIEQLEKQLAEEQTAAKREREQLAAESEYRIAAKEQAIKHQTTTIDSLTRELKEKQSEVDRLLKMGRDSPSPLAGDAGPAALDGREKRGGLLPPLQPPSPRAEEIQGQRAVESLHRQLRSKDSKIAKQAERLQALTEMLERRDQQLEELSSAKADRQKMQQKLADMEEVMKAQPRVVTHAEAERRLIEQEQRMLEDERRARELDEAVRKESAAKEALAKELAALRGTLAEGASSSGALQAENARLSAELVEAQRLLDGRTEELRRAREAWDAPADLMPDPSQVTSLPAMQRRLKRLEDVDKNLGRDVAVWLQERENKVESLNSTVTLLRTTVDDLRRDAAAAGTAAPSSLATPRAMGVNAATSPAVASPRDAGTSPLGALGRDMGTSAAASPSARDATTGIVGVPLQDAATGTSRVAARDAGIGTVPQASRDAATGTSGYPSRDAATGMAAGVGRDAATNTHATSDRGLPSGLPPYGQDAVRAPAVRQPPATAGAPERQSQIPDTVTAEDLRHLSAEDIRNELLARREDTNKLEGQLEEKKQLVMKLIEEANLCNAEVASLQQTVQQAYKAARKQDREYDKLMEERNNLEKTAQGLKDALEEKETRVTKMFTEVQKDKSGNATVDEIDSKITWKLKMLTPRQHEIRHSIFLVLNRRRTDVLDKNMLAQGLAHQFAIAASRIDIVEDTRLPDSAGDAPPAFGGVLAADHSGPPSGGDSPQDTPLRAGTPDGEGGGDGPDGDGYGALKRDLVLVNISDSETGEGGGVARSAVAAMDVLDQVRNDLLRGQRVGPLDGVAVDAVFINHGDMVLPFDWPAVQAQLLLREGRVLAGKHAIITVHEVRDPYVLRVVAYDTEVGREFVLFLNTRDVLLLLDTRDSELAQQQQALAAEGQLQEEQPLPESLLPYKHLNGPSVQQFREGFSVSAGQLLDVVVSSLSFSVWQGQQILVASEMRIPSPLQQQQEQQGTRALTEALADAGATQAIVPMETPGTAVTALPERGITRGMRSKQVSVKRLFEDVLGFQGRLCIFSMTHTTTPDLREDIVRATVYCPKTCSQVEACLTQPMLTDKMRIVAEVGELDQADGLCIAIVVEEVIYPPAFVVRITSVNLDDAHSMSPAEASKPHAHIIRVTKDGRNASHLPDMSFAISNSTMRSKLMRCIGASAHAEGPRETLLQMPAVSDITGQAGGDGIVPRIVTGHANERFGLTVKMVNTKSRALPGSGAETVTADAISNGERGTAAMTPAVRAQLRAKYGKGKLLVRHGRMLGFQGSTTNEAVRAVISVYERSQPYQHFVMCAYEPQTSREWELLADSIDIFKLFLDREERRSQALDLGNPATREKLANVLVNSVVLASRQDDIVLVLSPALVREHMEKTRKQANKDAIVQSAEPEVTGREPGDTIELATAGVAMGSGLGDSSFTVQPAISNVQTRAIGGFNGGYDRSDHVLVEQRGRDRLFTAQRRFATSALGEEQLYKICIYDRPLSTVLHSYSLVATPMVDTLIAASGLPTAILSDPSSPMLTTRKPPTYTLKVDDKMLEGFLPDPKLLEPSRQEELLNFISQNLHLDEDRDGQFRLCLRKKKLRAHQIKDALAHVGETGGRAPAAAHGDDQISRAGCREIGGNFPLNMLRLGTNRGVRTQGPGLSGESDEHQSGQKGLRVRKWKKVCCKAQRFGPHTVVITVSRHETTFKLSVYDPETSALYEMVLATCQSTSPLSILMERCDLGSKLDLVLCMHEVSFPHQVVVNLVHIPSQQEFNLRIGDDKVYTMIENSRRDGFMLYFEQLMTWGCIGFYVPPGTEEQALANVFEETFAGNQIFDRAQIDDVLQNQLVATTEGDELKPPTALAPQAPKKLRVPVVRTQLDFLGQKQAPPTGITMSLLYHGEHTFPKENATILFRVHKRAITNDIALTLRLRSSEPRSLPELPDHWEPKTATCAAHGRPFETPALAAAEGSPAQPDEVTLWLQDKCSNAPYGAYGEFCEVPGFQRPLLLLVTDEDSPRSIRVAVTLGQLPFTVLFQVVLLEASETNAKVESVFSLKPSASRRVLQQAFQRYFSKAGGGQSTAIQQIGADIDAQREHELRQKLDQLADHSGDNEHCGVESGPGVGGPQVTDVAREEMDCPVNTVILYMCTKRKIGRMMVFTIYRDLVGSHMYIRVVMRDPVAKKDSHLTLLHYTTQRLLHILRINRDMIEECREIEPDHVKQDRHQLRSELGKMIVDHLFLQRGADRDGPGEEIDHLEIPEGEDIEYELKMRDIMDSSNSALLTAKRRLLEVNDGGFGLMAHQQSIDSQGSMASARSLPLGLPTSADELPSPAEQPRTLLDTKEEAVLFKAEKEVSGRRVLITFYNETTPEDILHFSHNIRIVCACVQTLNVLAVQDFHEDTLELICERRGKRHLMSAAREQDLVRELWDSLVLQHLGQQITGIAFGGLEG